MSRVTAEWAWPFESRSDPVIVLKFDYDEALVARLKKGLAHCKKRGIGINPSQNRHQPGGWLPQINGWFVEPDAWPVLCRGISMLMAIKLPARPANRLGLPPPEPPKTLLWVQQQIKKKKRVISRAQQDLHYLTQIEIRLKTAWEEDLRDNDEDFDDDEWTS